MLFTLASMVLSMWITPAPGTVLQLFIMTLFLSFMMQYYGVVMRSLVTQPLSNRQKKTATAKLGQKMAGDTVPSYSKYEGN